MISVVKIFFTIVVTIIVYWGFKYRWRMGNVGKFLRENQRKHATSRNKSMAPKAQDLEQCVKCGSYIPAGAACSCDGKG